MSILGQMPVGVKGIRQAPQPARYGPLRSLPAAPIRCPRRARPDAAGDAHAELGDGQGVDQFGDDRLGVGDIPRIPRFAGDASTHRFLDGREDPLTRSDAAGRSRAGPRGSPRPPGSGGRRARRRPDGRPGRCRPARRADGRTRPDRITLPTVGRGPRVRPWDRSVGPKSLTAGRAGPSVRSTPGLRSGLSTPGFATGAHSPPIRASLIGTAWIGSLDWLASDRRSGSHVRAKSLDTRQQRRASVSAWYFV